MRGWDGWMKGRVDEGVSVGWWLDQRTDERMEGTVG